MTRSTIPLSRPYLVGRIERETVGVAGPIVPWDLPLQMTTWKVAPALAAGCTMAEAVRALLAGATTPHASCT